MPQSDNDGDDGNDTRSQIEVPSARVDDVGGTEGTHDLTVPLLSRTNDDNDNDNDNDDDDAIPSGGIQASAVNANENENENDSGTTTTTTMMTINSNPQSTRDYACLSDAPTSDSGSAAPDPNQRYPLDPRRFTILAVFCFNNLLGSAVWITFAPIEDAVEARFRAIDDRIDDSGSGSGSGSGISSNQIHWLMLAPMVLCGPSTALVAWAVQRHGFGETVMACSAAMAIGCGLRWWGLAGCGASVAVRYALLLAGQSLVAVAQTVFVNAPARLAASWFRQTTKPIGAVNLASSLGMIAMEALSPLCVVEDTGEHLDGLMKWQAVVAGLCALCTGIVFREDEPAVPPSAAEAARREQRNRIRQEQQQQQQQRQLLERGDSESPNAAREVSSPNARMFQEIQELLTNPQYIFLLTVFALVYGVNSAILTLTQPWLTSSGFSGDQTAGLCGSLITAGGVLGTLVAAFGLDKTKDYKGAVRWTCLAAFLSGIGLVATLRPSCPEWLLAATFLVSGMTQVPLMTIGQDAAAASTYPVSEELSSSGLTLLGNYMGVLLVDRMAGLIKATSGDDNDDDDDDDDNTNGDQKYAFAATVNLVYLALLAFSAAIAFGYKGDDKRASVVRNRAENDDDDDDDDDETPRNEGVPVPVPFELVESGDRDSV